MNEERKTAIVVGVLFITATVTAILTSVLLGSTLDVPNYLTTIAANEIRVVAVVILELMCAVSVLGIGVMMFPVLKKHRERGALGYVGIRLIEAVFIIIASLGLLSLITISKDSLGGTLNAFNYQPAGNLLLALRGWSYMIGTLIFLGLGGLFLNYVLYQSRLVPRWLSAWGLIGSVLILFYGLLGLFGVSTDLTSPTTVLALPIAVEEMVLAAWLIVKGFDSSAVASDSTTQKRLGGEP
jgi:hypothetical protein